MRVNITYSVDIENIPTTVGSLIDETKEKLFLPVNKKIDNLLALLSQDNEKKAAKLIDEVRQDLAKIDSRLLDCGNILEGYQQAILNIENANNKAPEK